MKLFKLKGENTRKTLENWSFLIIVISAVLIFIGILLGSFVKYTVLLATFGSFFVIIGILIYVISQFMKGE